MVKEELTHLRSEVYERLPDDWVLAPDEYRRPGHIGDSRDQKHRQWTRRYGERRDYLGGRNSWKAQEAGWDLMWWWGNSLVPKPYACQIYEDSYFAYVAQHP